MTCVQKRLIIVHLRERTKRPVGRMTEVEKKGRMEVIETGERRRFGPSSGRSGYGTEKRACETSES